MNELTRTQQQALIECLRALEAGASVQDCLARFSQHASALRPYLTLRARLLDIETPEPPAAAHAAGRRALLERLATPMPKASRSLRWAALPMSFASRWFQSPLPRVAAAAALVLALAGGALGASAAAGVDQAHDVLSALHIVSSSAQGDQHKNPNAGEGASNQNDGIGNAPTAAATGQQHADDRASNGSGNSNSGVGEDHRPCLPAEVWDRVPALQERFSACPADDSESEGPTAHTPEPNDEDATETPSSEEQETPHPPSSDPGERPHPDEHPNVTPEPSQANEDSDSGAPEQPVTPPPAGDDDDSL